MCVWQNVQHRELKLPGFTRLAVTAIVMIAVSTSGPTDCPVSPPPLSFQNAQSSEKALASHKAQGETPNMCLALGTNGEGYEIIKGKASRMVQSSRIGSGLLCVCRYAQHLELNLPELTRFSLITVEMVTVSTGGPTSGPVSPPLVSFKNVQSHKSPHKP